MKKVNLNGKLSLKKETIAKLNNQQMNLIHGGIQVNNSNGAGPCTGAACPPNASANIPSYCIACVGPVPEPVLL